MLNYWRRGDGSARCTRYFRTPAITLLRTYQRHLPYFSHPFRILTFCLIMSSQLLYLTRMCYSYTGIQRHKNGSQQISSPPIE